MDCDFKNAEETIQLLKPWKPLNKYVNLIPRGKRGFLLNFNRLLWGLIASHLT